MCVEAIGGALEAPLSCGARGALRCERLVWVNAIVGAAFAAPALFAFVCVPVLFVTRRPPVLSLGLVLVVEASLGFALLMVVMRQPLTQATGLRESVAEVI